MSESPTKRGKSVAGRPLWGYDATADDTFALRMSPSNFCTLSAWSCLIVSTLCVASSRFCVLLW